MSRRLMSHRVQRTKCRQHRSVRRAGAFGVLAAGVFIAMGGGCATASGPFVAGQKPVTQEGDAALAVLELTTPHADRRELTHHLRNRLMIDTGLGASDAVEVAATLDNCRAAGGAQAACQDGPDRFFARPYVVTGAVDAAGGGYFCALQWREENSVMWRSSGQGATPALAISDASKKLAHARRAESRPQ